MPGAEVAEGAVVTRTLVADGVKIGKNAVVGSADSKNIELVAKRDKGMNNMNRAFGIINFAGNHIKVDGLQDFLLSALSLSSDVTASLIFRFLI